MLCGTMRYTYWQIRSTGDKLLVFCMICVWMTSIETRESSLLFSNVAHDGGAIACDDDVSQYRMTDAAAVAAATVAVPLTLVVLCNS